MASDKVRRANQEARGLLRALPFLPLTFDLIRESVAEVEVAERLVMHYPACVKHCMCILQQGFSSLCILTICGFL